jgi:hypothetical protein
VTPNPILQALANCDPNTPLEPKDDRFVDLDDIRGTAIRKQLLKLVQAADTVETFAKVAVAGHRGAGKSTELNRAQADLVKSGYVVLWASVNENLDPKEISFSDVIRLLVLLLDDAFGQYTARHEAVKQAFDVVAQWFREVTKSFSADIESAKELGLKGRLGGAAGIEGGAEGGVNAGAVAKGGLKFKTDLGELSAAISVVRRSAGKEHIEIRETLERYNSQLIENVNALLRAVTTICCDGKRLVIILDNVDKYEPSVVNHAFLRNAGLFGDLETHLVFTIQSSLLHSPVEDAVEQSFTPLVLPMLPVFERHTRNPDMAVVPVLRDAVYRRVPKALFAEGDESVDELILASGGCWRDLLRLLQAALLKAGTVVGARDVLAAKQQVGQAYRRLLRSEQDLKILAETHLKHIILSDEPTRYLLHHLCILAYNGEGWYDIHPLLENHKPVQEAVDAARRV